MTTILYEGLPTQGLNGQADGGIWWRLVEKYRANVMFSAPTAIRVLKRQDPSLLRQHDLSSLRALFLAGEPLDEPTSRWIGDGLGVPIVDNYWQTETGWPMIAMPQGLKSPSGKLGSPGQPVYGWNVKLVDEQSGEEILEPNRKGVLVVETPMPPGFMQTLWRDENRFRTTYWAGAPGKQRYSTFDWAVRDEDGFIFILGRTDDVINVAGHRLGTREIEECIGGHPAVAEVAVVGVADSLKGQVAVAFVVPRPTGLPEQRQEPADQRPSTRPLGAARGTCKSAPHPSRWRRRSLQPDQVGLGRDGPPRCGRGWWYHRKTISWMDVAWCPMFWTAGCAIRFDWLGQPRTAQALQWKERDTQWSPFFSRLLARWRSRSLSHAHDDTAAHFTLHKSVGSFDGT